MSGNVVPPIAVEYPSGNGKPMAKARVAELEALLGLKRS